MKTAVSLSLAAAMLAPALNASGPAYAQPAPALIGPNAEPAASNPGPEFVNLANLFKHMLDGLAAGNCDPATMEPQLLAVCPNRFLTPPNTMAQNAPFASVQYVRTVPATGFASPDENAYRLLVIDAHNTHVNFDVQTGPGGKIQDMHIAFSGALPWPGMPPR